jgi:hypothetical protein
VTLRSTILLILISFIAPVALKACNPLKSSLKDHITTVKGCKSIQEIYQVIEDAIFVGAPTYNAGNQLGCYRIYEGAAYKIIYYYGSQCKDIKKLLKTALKKCDDYFSASDKAWVMRKAFDEILGVPTITG